jgi:hypothetical protein
MTTLDDIKGQAIQAGDFIVYTGGGVTAPDLKFGWVRRVNPDTDKIWVEHGTWDRLPSMRQTWDRVTKRWVDTNEPEGVSIVNHTQTHRFMIL